MEQGQAPDSVGGGWGGGISWHRVHAPSYVRRQGPVTEWGEIHSGVTQLSRNEDDPPRARTPNSLVAAGGARSRKPAAKPPWVPIGP